MTELEHDPAFIETESETPAARPAPRSRWLAVGLGLLGLIVIAVLAWPTLSQQISRSRGQAGPPLAELKQAAEANPADSVLQYRLAGAYYQASQFEEAWAQFRTVADYRLAADAGPEIARAEQAVHQAPASKEAHFRLGTTWARAQLLEPAEIAFKQALTLGPRYADAHANLGVVYYQMGRLSDALHEFDAVLALHPEDADVRHNRGNVFVQQALQTSPPDEKLLAEAIAEFQRALEINPGLAQAHFSLGAVYFIQGQQQEAIAEFQEFMALDDGSDPTATSAAQSYLEQLGQ
jgi:tetratricopeptide (TPR) repeat protein